MRIGRYKIHKTGSEAYRSFIPVKLPIDVQIDPRLMEKTSSILAELGNLSVPSLDLFLYMYVRKEAVLSSQIEGTQSSLNDLILFENNQKPDTKISDVKEVSRYVEALNYGIARINSGFPLCLRLLREIHSIFLYDTRYRCLSQFRKARLELKSVEFLSIPKKMANNFLMTVHIMTLGAFRCNF